MFCGYALKGGSAADFESDVDEDVKQDYAETDPGDAITKENLDTIDDLLEGMGREELILGPIVIPITALIRRFLI